LLYPWSGDMQKAKAKTAKKDKIQYEERIRANIYLPSGKKEENNALNEVISYFQQKRILKGNRVIEGFTKSNPFPPPFTGYWWDEGKEEFADDIITIIVIDYKIKFTTESREFDNEIEIIRNKIAEIYKNHGADQKEFWIIAQPVRRYA